MRFTNRDVIVIGAGVDGLLNTYLARQAGYTVTTFVRTGSARGSTYNNQAWFQSGLLYGMKDLELGRLIRVNGPRLLEAFAFRQGRNQGVFRVASEEAREHLKWTASMLAMDGVEQLEPKEERRLLGPYYREGHFSFRVPDCPFPEADLMQAIRDAAENLGAEFIGFPEGVALKPIPGEAEKCYVETPDGNFVGDVATLVCAGAFTNVLLAPLRASVPGLTLFRSPLMRIPNEPRLEADLLVDLSGGGLSVLRHVVHHSLPQTWLVIGNRKRTPVDAQNPAPDPLPNEEEEVSLVSLLPQAPPRDRRLVNCCYKAEMLSASGEATVRSWATAVDGYPGLFAGGSGKATLGLHAAELMLHTAGLTGGSGGDGPGGGDMWRDVPRSWFE